MTRSIFGWDLPPGVTQRMIDEAAGVGTQECYDCALLTDLEELDHTGRCQLCAHAYRLKMKELEGKDD